MRRIVRIHNSVCEHCDEGKNKAETTQGIVACTTCGAEDPNFVPLISESDFFRDAYKRRGGTEKIHIFEHSRNRKNAKLAKPTGQGRNPKRHHATSFLDPLRCLRSLRCPNQNRTTATATNFQKIPNRKKSLEFPPLR